MVRSHAHRITLLVVVCTGSLVTNLLLASDPIKIEEAVASTAAVHSRSIPASYGAESTIEVSSLLAIDGPIRQCYQREVAYHERALGYGGVMACDAAGREQVTHRKSLGSIPALIAGDEDTVTIGPLLSEADWSEDSTFFTVGVGDINNDGYDDVLTYGWNGIRVYHGSATGLGGSPDWSPPTSISTYSSGFAGAGDVNGDGYDDVIIQSIRVRQSGGIESWVSLFQGSADGLSDVPNWSINGYYESFGERLASAGDVNGDGYDDVIIAGPKYIDAVTTEDAVFAYYGSPSGLSMIPDWSVAVGPRGARFGSSIASAGDVNGDNYDDVIIGSRSYSADYWPLEGAVYIYYGSSTGLKNHYGWMAKGNYTHANLGASVSGLGDINNDGYDDVIAGAPNELLHPIGTGRAYIFLGSADGMGVTPVWNEGLDSLPGGSRCAGSGCRYGEQVAGVGDINGDGYVDMIVGARGYVAFDMRAGHGTLFIYYGDATGMSHNPRLIPGDFISNEFSFQVAAAGDVNGDGLNDIMATGMDARVFLFYGASSPTIRNLSGVVVGNSDSPVVGANVMLDGNESLVVNTDTNGRFIFPSPLASGHHTITVRANGFNIATFDLTMSDENKHVVLGLIPSNATLPMPPFRFCATVTATNGDGPILSGVTVEVIQLGNIVNESVTDAQGTGCSDTLQSGSYQVRFSKPGYQTLVTDLELNTNKQIVVSLIPSNLE